MPVDYAGNPNNFPTAITIPSSNSDPPSSTLFGTAFEGTIDRTAHTLGLSAAVAAASWRNPNVLPDNGVTGTATAWLTAHWDPITNAWLLGANFPTAGFQLLSTPGLGDEASGGYTFVPSTSVSIPSTTVRTLENDGTNYYAAGVQTGAASVFKMAENGVGGWTSTLTPTGSDYTDVKLRRFEGNIYVFLASHTNSAHTLVEYSADNGTTWNAAGASLFTGFTPLVADNGTIIVFMGSGSGNTSYITGSLSSWTVRSLAFLAHSDSLQGLVYDARTELFVLITEGTDFRLHAYTSPDGVFWTEGGSISLSGRTLQPFAACTATGCIAILVTDSSEVDHVAYTTDDGATWYQAQASLSSDTGSIVGPMIHAGPAGFCAHNQNNLRFSYAVGHPTALS